MNIDEKKILRKSIQVCNVKKHWWIKIKGKKKKYLMKNLAIDNIVRELRDFIFKWLFQT